MRSSHTFTRLFGGLFSILLMAAAAYGAGPGVAPPVTAEANDQKAGSLLY